MQAPLPSAMPAMETNRRDRTTRVGAANDRKTMPGYYAIAVNDVISGVSEWRIWTMLASNDIKQRYRRSAIGQFWLTLSMAIMIFGLGAVYSILFNTDIKTYIPYVATTFVMWGFIGPVITESASAFIENERIMLHASVAPSVFIFRMVCRNIFVLAHNILIIPAVFAVFGVGINWNILWLIPGLILVVLNCFWIGYVIAIICARYRDVPQIVASVMQIMFFVTPIMFLPSQLATHPYILLANPLASFLEVMRDPILGQMPSIEALSICAGLFIVGSIITLAFAGQYSRRIVYWL
jgi:ABC-type polysaccharide/polyol phosphate export permease